MSRKTGFTSLSSISQPKEDELLMFPASKPAPPVKPQRSLPQMPAKPSRPLPQVPQKPLPERPVSPKPLPERPVSQKPLPERPSKQLPPKPVKADKNIPPNLPSKPLPPKPTRPAKPGYNEKSINQSNGYDW